MSASASASATSSAMSNVVQLLDAHLKANLLNQFAKSSEELIRKCVAECAAVYGFDPNDAFSRLGLNNGGGVNVIVNSNNTTNTTKTTKTTKIIKNKPTKFAFPLPFSGVCIDSNCFALTRNSGLYTQCNRPKADGSDFCTNCSLAMNKKGLLYPEFGTIQMRCDVPIDQYVDPKGNKPVHYSKIMKHLNLTKELVLEEAMKHGITVDDIHFSEAPASKRGRPKSDKPKKETSGKRGRPKAKPIVVDADTNDLFDALIHEANIPSKSVHSKSVKDADEEDADEEDADEEEADKADEEDETSTELYDVIEDDVIDETDEPETSHDEPPVSVPAPVIDNTITDKVNQRNADKAKKEAEKAKKELEKAAEKNKKELEKAAEKAKKEQEKLEKAKKIAEEKAKKELEKLEKAKKIAEEKAKKELEKNKKEAEKTDKATTEEKAKKDTTKDKDTMTLTKFTASINGVKTTLLRSSNNIVYDFSLYSLHNQLKPIGSFDPSTKSIQFYDDETDNEDDDNDELSHDTY